MIVYLPDGKNPAAADILRVSGRNLKVQSARETPPEGEAVLGWCCKGRSWAKARGAAVLVAGKLHVIRRGKLHRVLVKPLGWLPVVQTADDSKGWVSVCRLRPWPLLLLLALMALPVWSASSDPGPVPSVSSLFHYEGQMSEWSAEEEPEEGGEIDYTTFQSIPDPTVWKEGSATQDLLLVNPEGNSVDLAPRVFVDLDGDGQFSSTECVYNPLMQDESGEIADLGTLIAPGCQIESVELNRSLAAGTYRACVSFDSYLSGSHDLANPLTFTFSLEVV